MQTEPPHGLLPVLVAHLAKEHVRETLDAAAFTGDIVWIPLKTAPMSVAEHVLEVHTPNAAPFFYIAQPQGPPTESGFPLRLEPMSTDRRMSHRRIAVQPEALSGRRSYASEPLGESHGPEVAPPDSRSIRSIRDSIVGRALASGKLVIEELIGRGGVGAVYKARHRQLMMPVAVKVLQESFQSDVEFCRRFYAEALAASRLDHPNITRVIDFGQEPDGQLYFAMEYLDGVELRSVLDRERKLAGPRIATVMMQVCAALSHAHARGIVHRDIKPENLVLVASQDDDGRPIEVVKVCDFGIALYRAVSPKEEGIIAGTPEYMSPEQSRSDELDARSDIYACGVVLYELATGQVPFTAQHPAQVLNKHQFSPPLPPSKIDASVDPILEDIIMKALSKEPSERHASMRELRSELRELLAPHAFEGAPLSTAKVASGPESRPMAPRRERLPTWPDDDGSGQISRPNAPEWLERGPVYANAHAPPSNGAPMAAPAQAGRSTDLTSDLMAHNIVGWTTRLIRTNDPRAFAQAAQKFEGALRVLAQRGDVDALWHLSSTIDGISPQKSAGIGSQCSTAAQLLRAFEDPAFLVQIAEHLLSGPAESHDNARRLLVRAGEAGAHALYRGRVKLVTVAAGRSLFVAVLKDFGAKACPVVKAALEKIAATPAPNAATIELAEDLLLCLPAVRDESAGHVILKFLRWPHSGVCRAATAAIVKLWGERAKPVLVTMVQSKEDVVRVAGIAGLRQLGAIDEHLVPRLHAILTRRVAAGEEVRAAAAIALAHTSATARQPAVSLLSHLLSAPDDRDIRAPASQRSAIDGAISKQDAVVLAMARSLLAIGGAPYRGLVAQRAEQSPEPLRSQLRRLLT